MMETESSNYSFTCIPQVPFGIAQLEKNTCFFNAALQSFSTAFLEVFCSKYTVESHYKFIRLVFQLLTECHNSESNCRQLLELMMINKQFSTFKIGSMDDSFLFLRCLVSTFQDENEEFYKEFTIVREMRENECVCCELQYESKTYPPMYYLQNETNVQEQVTILIESGKICSICEKRLECKMEYPTIFLFSTRKEVLRMQIDISITVEENYYYLCGISCSTGIHAVSISFRNGRWYLCNDQSVRLYHPNIIGNIFLLEKYYLPLGLVYLRRPHPPLLLPEDTNTTCCDLM